MRQETFSKAERLCSKKAIAELFEKGSSFFCFPLQVVWLESPSDIPFPAQVSFSVTKKDFRHAVTRNLIKRRMKEAYRKNKQVLYNLLNSSDKKIIFMIIYKDNSIPEFKTIAESIIEINKKFITLLA
jgi:ribonuclease P protein component